MPIQAKTVAFNIDTTKLATQTQDITGFGFTPTAGTSVLLLEWGGQLGTVDAINADAIDDTYYGYGFAVSATQRACITLRNEDAEATSIADGGSFDDACLVLLQASGASEGKIDWNAWITDGVQIIYDVAFGARSASLGGALRVHATIITGLSTAPEVVTWQANAATGNQNISHAATTYNFALTIGASRSTNNTVGVDCVSSIGVASSTDQFVIGGVTLDAQATAVSKRYGVSGEYLARVISTGVSNRWSFTSFNSGSISVNKLEGAGTFFFYTLLLSAPLVVVGEEQTQTVTTTDITVAGLQGKVRAGLVFSHGTTESVVDTNQGHNQVSMGMFTWDGTTITQGAQTAGDEDGPTTTQAISAVEHDNVQISLDVTTSTILGLMEVFSITNNLQSANTVVFRNTDDADDVRKFFGYAIVGDSLDAPPGGGLPLLFYTRDDD